MVKIVDIDEFNKVHASDIGYIIISKPDSKILHSPNCEKINSERFFRTLESDEHMDFHWYSTIALIEKHFPEHISCKTCKPD